MKKLVLLLSLIFMMTLGGCFESKEVKDEVQVFRNGDFLSSYQEIYFRGTPNNWEKTSMNLVADYTWEIVSYFESGDNTGEARFKIDVSGNWREAYPSNDKIVASGKSYKILFDERDKKVEVGEYLEWGDGTATINLISSDSLEALDGVEVELKKENNYYATSEIIYNNELLLSTLSFVELEEGNYTFSIKKEDSDNVYEASSEFVVNKNAANYNGEVIVVVEELEIESLNLEKNRDTVALGKNYTLPTNGIATLSNGSTVAIDLIWDKEANTTILGETIYTATANYNGRDYGLEV